MRISDWSSDVCSSDLNATARVHNDLGNLYKRRRQNNKALVHYKKALDLVRQLNFLPGISACLSNIGTVYLELRNPRRSEERRVGKECVSTCRSRWARYH